MTRRLNCANFIATNVISINNICQIWLGCDVRTNVATVSSLSSENADAFRCPSSVVKAPM